MIRKIKNLKTIRRVNLFLILFFGISFFVFFLMNGGAYWRILRYELFLLSPFSGDDLDVQILEVSAAARPVLGNPTSPDETTPTTEEPGSGETRAVPENSGKMRLVIPKIKVAAPIIIPSDSSNKGVLAALEEGVGMYPTSVGIGESGRSVVLGHSSLASWYRGEWAYVFSLLPKMEQGDEFYITANGKKFVYRVFDKKILTPADTNALLSGSSFGSEIDLITCYPIGGASKRNIIQAQLISTENI